jgi:SRSO17 transposase
MVHSYRTNRRMRYGTSSIRLRGRWLKQVIEKLGHKKRRQMCPLYVTGLFKPGERKSIEPSHCPGVGTVRLPI